MQYLTWRFTFLVLLFPGFLAACGGGSGGAEEPAASETAPAESLSVQDARARTGPSGGTSAAYMHLVNPTDAPDSLVAARSDAAELVELHETYDRGEGMRGMREVPAIAVPAGDTTRLEPGGLHVMLIRLTRDLQAGDSLALELDFARSGARVLTLPVQSLQGAGASE